MQCPRCNIPLRELEIKGITVDTCDQCSGLWLDDKELNKVKNSDEIQLDPISKKIENDEPVTCLRCGNQTEKINYSYSSGIIIDKCPVCYGVWLDGGEFASIIEFLKKDSDFDVEALKKFQRNHQDEEINKMYTSSIVRFFGKFL